MKSMAPNGMGEKTAEQEKLYQTIIDYSVEAILIHTNCKIVYVNQSGAEFLKASKEMIIGTNVLALFSKNAQGAIKKRIDKGIADQPLSLIEETVMKHDGTIAEVEMHCRPVMFGTRKVMQTVLRDITARKKSERRLQDQEQLASTGQIAAGIAHEVKNPLTAVKGFLQLLQESQPNPYLETMETELDKALLTLENLLQVSKPDLHDEPQVPIDFCKELQALSLLFQDKLYRIEIEMDLRNTGYHVKGKKNLYLKAFFNLMKNAVEAIQSKGKITISHFVDGEWVHIKISDTGSGIEKEKIKMLGTPFFSDKAEGTGLGLTQVYTTVSEHGGHISVASAVGKGTTFHIRLPAFINK